MVVPLKHRQSLIMYFDYAGACFCMYVSEQMDIFLILNLTVSFKKGQDVSNMFAVALHKGFTVIIT